VDACNPESMAASPTLSAPAVDAPESACFSPKSYASASSDKSSCVGDACVEHLKHTTTNAFVNACDPEGMAASPALSAPAVNALDDTGVFSKLHTSSISDEGFGIRNVCVNHSKHPTTSTTSASVSACDPVSLAASPALRAPAVDAPDNKSISQRSYISSTSVENLDAGNLGVNRLQHTANSVFVNECSSPRSCVSKISDVGIGSSGLRHFQESSHDDVETLSADILPTGVITRQPCEVTFSTLVTKDLIKASMTCRKSS
jgi:hypothetical protein